MRIVASVGFALCLAAGLLAQGRTGSVVYPGGAPGTPGVTRTPTSVVHPGGGGVRPGTPAPRPTGVSPRTIYVYPVFIGSYGGSGYYDQSYTTPQDPSASVLSQPSITVVIPPQPAVVNNYYSGTAAPDQDQPVVETEDPTPTTDPSHYLIAFKDHTIYAATAYWVDGDTLHYFTSGNTHNQASLSLVDREFTERLNKEAGVEVKLPAPAK